MDFVKRPTAKDTDVDLLQLQAEFASRQNSTPSVKIIRPKPKADHQKQSSEILPEAKPKLSNSKPKDRELGRFNIQLDEADRKTHNILSMVQERFPGYFDFPDKCTPFIYKPCNEFAKEDGFPDVLDLSDYYKPRNSMDKVPNVITTSGKSIFATEFLRRADLACHGMPSTSSVKAEIEQASLVEENEAKLNQMSEEEISKAQQEILARFDPKTIEFLKNRGKNREDMTERLITKDSEFKKRRKAEKIAISKVPEPSDLPKTSKESEPPTPVVADEVIKNLEVIDPEQAIESEELNPYTRLAMDPVQLDITNKCLRNLGSRQQLNLLKLFDNLKIRPNDSKEDSLLESCRQHIEDIKALYLEEYQVEENRTVTQFAEDINPLADGAWFLVPIRRVLDAVQIRKSGATPDDLDIVRLTFQWTMLLMYEKQTMFYTLSQPNDVFIRVAETFLIGPEIFTDETIYQCLSRLIHEYLFKKGFQHLLKFRINKPISGLDAFMPFFEDLIKSFEEFSYCDENYSLVLLIGAYMNSFVDDSLLSIGSLWAPDRNVVRQMTISMEKAKKLLEFTREWRVKYIEEVEEVLYERYSQILAMYAAAIRDEKVTKDRNPTMFAIASTEIGEFIKRHTIESFKHPKRSADLAIMVELLRRTVSGNIEL